MFGKSWEDVYAVVFQECSDASLFRSELAEEARESPGSRGIPPQGNDPFRFAVLLHNSIKVPAGATPPCRGLWFTKEDLNIAFSIAVSSHSYHIMKLLLDIGEVNPKGTGRSGVPWIFLAAGGESYGELYPKKAVETLIEHGAEPDLFYHSHTLISYSILHQELERTFERTRRTVEYLLDKGACINGRKESVPLCIAASKGALAAVCFLLELGAQVNQLQNLHSARSYVQKDKEKRAPHLNNKKIDKLLKKKGGEII